MSRTLSEEDKKLLGPVGDCGCDDCYATAGAPLRPEDKPWRDAQKAKKMEDNPYKPEKEDIYTKARNGDWVALERLIDEHQRYRKKIRNQRETLRSLNTAILKYRARVRNANKDSLYFLMDLGERLAKR